MTSIAELRRLEAEATQGKWIAAPYSSKVGMPIVASPSGKSVAKITYWKIGPGFENHERESEANAALIVAMRNALPELLKALEEAREALEEAQPYVARYESENFSNAALNTYSKIEAAIRTLPPHGGVDVG